MKLNKKNSLLIAILILSFLFLMKLCINYNTMGELEYEKERMVEVTESVRDVEGYEKVNIEVIKKEKMIVMYDYVEEDSIMWYPKGYEEISQRYSSMYYESQKKEGKYNFVHVYLSDNLEIYYITVNGVTVYEYADNKENNEYYKIIYNTILEKTLNNEVEYLDFNYYKEY